MNKKKIILIIGPSGSGKTTLIEKAFENDQVLRSHASRDMRPGEINGENYIFVSKTEFEKMLANNEFVQFVKYNDNYYGVSAAEINSKLKKFDTVVVAVVFETIQQYQNYFKSNDDIEIIPVFTSINKENLLQHFSERTEPQEQKDIRISLYEKEMLNQKYFSHDRIIDMNQNDHAESASKQLLNIVQNS